MITTEIETRRFYTGELVNYVDASTAWLFEQSQLGADRDMQAFAAAGLVRAVLDVPVAERTTGYVEALDWASSVVVQVRASGQIPLQMDPYVESLPAVSATLDSVSVAATKANQPKRVVEIVNGLEEVSEDLLVLGIGHGGILAAADTYLAMEGTDDQFYPVRYSRGRSKDTTPVLSGYEIEKLQEYATGRSVVIVDEDRSSSQTIIKAVRHFAGLLRAPVIGVTVTHARHPKWFWPAVINARCEVIYEKMH